MDTIINIVTSVPVLFIIFFLIAYLFIAFMGNYAAVGAESERKVEAYASGQRHAKHRAAPDYSTFFPFAMFFTLMHVLTLVVTTAPSCERSVRSPYSMPEPKVPEAVTTGFFNVTPAISTSVRTCFVVFLSFMLLSLPL